MSASRRRVAVLSAFLALALGATWPLAAHLAEALPSDLGDPVLAASILGWDAERVRHLFRGLWDAPIFFPYQHTLAFSEHLLGIAVPFAPLVWITGTPLVVYNVAFIASFVLAGFAMYLLVVELTGREDAGFLAGVIFGFAPARFAQISHLQVLASGWTPLALLMLHRFTVSRSRRALAGFVCFFVIQAYSNGYSIYFLALATLIVLGAAAVHDETFREIAPLAIAALAIAAALLPIVYIYFDVRRSYGLQRTELDVTTFGADLGAYLRGAASAPAWIEAWRLLPSVAKPLGPEGELFPGLAALLLACAGWWPASTKADPYRARPTYAALALVALFLSLGVRPAMWGRTLPLGHIYAWLFAHLPGFDGLRVPARFSLLVSIAIAVAAGFGFVRMTGRMRAPARAAVCAALVAIVFFEGAPRALPLAAFKPRGRPDRAAYTWIRDEEAGAVLELPIGALDKTARAAQYGYQTLVHGKRIVNGFGGYDSPLQTWLGGAGSPLLDFERFGDAVRMLRSLGVGTIVFHADGFDDPAVAEATLRALRAARDQVTSEAQFPGILVFRLSPQSPVSSPQSPAPSPESLAPVPPSAFQATASSLNSRLSLAFDGDPETRWVSGANQSGTEWIEIAFDRPRDLASVTLLTTARSLTDYPRRLLVEMDDGSGAWSPLFDGSVVEKLGEGLARDPRRGPIDIDLPANRTSRLRLRQLGRTETLFWSVDELQLRERR